eukprot:11204257-Lingulodinium_polyedra.AAC.1
MCAKQVEFLARVAKRQHEKEPFILISCLLSRVAVPLGYLVGEMWPTGEVAVCMVPAAALLWWRMGCGIGG